MTRSSAVLLGAALLPLLSRARVDTSTWLGSAYTPSAASNTLWWPWFDRYAPMIDRELGMARRRFGMTTLRVFLHTLVYEANATALLASLDGFLAIASRHSLQTGIVLFDSCWNSDGANVSSECMPIKGRHNGCWFESPELSGQTSVERYRPYVEDVVRGFGSDPRVAYIEIYNEPRGPGEDFVFALRDAGFRWARALSPAAPIISCWDDNNDTEIVDRHEYDTSFKSSLLEALFADEAKGAVITEGGSRWYQPPFPGDFGSPLTYLNFLTALRRLRDAGNVSYAVSGMLNWILFVGNDNTRWHWGSPDESPEPAIPWDGWLFPDGTPVSHTEAGAARRLQTGVDEFLSFSKFLTDPPVPEDGDAFLTLEAGSAWSAPLKAGLASIGDALFEASLWVEEGGAASLTVRAGSVPRAGAGARVAREDDAGVRRSGRAFLDGAKRRKTASPPQPPPAARPARGDGDSCSFGPTLNNTDVCSGGPPGYRDLSVATAPDPLAACAAACCSWAECTAWIVRPLSGTDKNCTNELCCWLKPGCQPGQTSPVPGATAQFLAPRPGPPLPGGIDGYNFTLSSTENLLIASRQSGGHATQLGAFNTSTLENGLVRGAWNLLRVLLVTQADGSLTLRVWLNPMLPETGFTGDPALDSVRTPLPLPERLVLVDANPLPAGGIAVAAGGSAGTQVDYVSALPASVF